MNSPLPDEALLFPEEEVRDEAVSEAKEKAEELELEERELQRECSEMLDMGDVLRAGMGNWLMIGVIQVGAAISSLRRWKIWASSSLSASTIC